MSKLISIMIVEDDPMVRQVNRQFIEAVGGFNVVGMAKNGVEGVKMAGDLNPDLVILDIYLPDMDGVTALQQIRQLNLPIDVIMVTAAQDAETIQKVLRYGAIDYIVKPFRFDRLKGALENYKRMYRKMRTIDSLCQEDIDSFTLSHSKTTEALPKGLNEATLKQVMVYMSSTGEALSAEAVAEGVGLARVTARRYLEHLTQTGQLGLEVKYGSVGRPVNLYRRN